MVLNPPVPTSKKSWPVTRVVEILTVTIPVVPATAPILKVLKPVVGNALAIPAAVNITFLSLTSTILIKDGIRFCIMPPDV